MNDLHDFAKLSEKEKDDLILALLMQVKTLTAEVADLKGRLALTSRNSSKPPTSDGLSKPAPKPKSLRIAGQNPTGGQKGHTGHTLKKVEKPDYIESHPAPSHCDACRAPLVGGTVIETRQVFDLPTLRHEVTEHQVLQTQCSCGKVHRGVFPEDVTAPAQYGPRAMAAAVLMTNHHMGPVARTGELMGDLFDLPMSNGTILKASKTAQTLLTPTVELIANALQVAPVVGADETGMRVATKLHWMHVLVTATLTWMACHTKRGKEAFDDMGILPLFMGTLIHDGWKPYRELLCKHGLCNAHHLRELTYQFEELQQAWAKRMIELLVGACHEVGKVGGPLSQERMVYYRLVYEEILVEGETANQKAPPIPGKRGKTPQSKGFNLLGRLRDYKDDVWRFATDPGVPFTNNLAEQAVRMSKVKQKIAGCFRTKNGIDTYCTIRSYLATMRKQKANIYQSLVLTFQGKTPQPKLA